MTETTTFETTARRLVVDPPLRRRGGSPAAIRGVLARTGPAGLAHWRGQNPHRPPQEPVDVLAGTRPPGPLPPTS